MVGGDIQIRFSTYFHESNKKDDEGCRKFQGHARKCGKQKIISPY